VVEVVPALVEVPAVVDIVIETGVQSCQGLVEPFVDH